MNLDAILKIGTMDSGSLERRHGDYQQDQNPRSLDTRTGG
jgi:hypothetical protein